MKKVTVSIPATSANLGPGFDVLGVALHLFNQVSMEADAFGSSSVPSRLLSLSVDVEGEGFDLLPRDSSNLVVRAACRVFETVKRRPTTLRVKLVNNIPLARGLGSSAAATLGGMYAANHLCGKPLSDHALLNLAVAMEGHADNIVPALVGGLCVAGIIERSTRYLRFSAPTDLHAVLCIPEKPMATAKARRVLPSRIPLSAAVFTSSRVAFLLGSLLQKRYEWLGFSMQDVLHQPARAHLIPGLQEVIEEANKAGAWGAALSGAGSSVLAFSKAGAAAKRVGRAMQKRFAARGIPSRWFETSFENKGIRIIL